MTRYLLAAEADKIQDLIFRASRLREVVGGSQLLSRFCKEVPQMILPNGARIIVNDGGSFRVLFNSKNEAVKFGDRLAELYWLALGGSLTVASPIEMNGSFRAAAERANKALRQAKQHRDGFVATSHLPYVAFCVSCGIGLAVEHSARPGERRRQYLCADCRAKRHEGADPGEFLSDFFEKVVGDEWHEYRWPGERAEKEREDPPMDVARFDARNYIAYLVADGNSMGEAFGECDKGQLESLSQTLR
ncbi:MAG TPA: hypothetical protein EYP19_16325, partial [Desulfobacterales bacterium]|nr:hypothetical protein [Desulfobacterales bacterium]